MGFAIAERAAHRGARVTLIAGPVALATPTGVDRIDVRGALEMKGALGKALGPDLKEANVLVMAAAVGDYRPKDRAAQKLKRSDASVSIELVPNPDLLAEIGARRVGKEPLLVGFAVETDTPERIVELAREKLQKKRVDLVVANHASDSFGLDDNRASIVEASRSEALGTLSKRALADVILDRVATSLERKGS
jgi:phosphopantothenoylcysteine decarboxylase/phosphopantothenate--cysteine ligase